MSVKTIISHKTGKREDKAEYPSKAVREAILNAAAAQTTLCPPSIKVEISKSPRYNASIGITAF